MRNIVALIGFLVLSAFSVMADSGLFALGVSTASMLDGAIDSIASTEARECFRDAYVSLQGSCRDMDETAKRVIAIRFLWCHLHASRRSPPRECSGIRSASAESALQCVSKLDGTHFQLFTSFVVHSDVICQHTAHTLYQQRAESASAALLRSASRADSVMRNLSHGLGSVVSDQRQVVRAQSVVIESVKATSSAIRTHHGRLSRSIGQLANTSDAAFLRMQRKLGRIDSTLDAILHLERLIASMAGSAWAAGWHAAVLGAAWLTTSDAATAGARPGIVVIAAATIGAEAIAGRWAGAGAAGASASLFGWPLSDVIAALRYGQVGLMLLCIAWRGFTFEDTGRAALSKLRELEQLLRARLGAGGAPDHDGEIEAQDEEEAAGADAGPARDEDPAQASQPQVAPPQEEDEEEAEEGEEFAGQAMSKGRKSRRSEPDEECDGEAGADPPARSSSAAKRRRRTRRSR